jgi:hypothetical protein
MQALEGDIDTVHFGFLHAGHVVPERDMTPGSADYYALKHREAEFHAYEHEIGATRRGMANLTRKVLRKLPGLRRVLITKAEIQRYLKVGDTAVRE